MPEEKVARKGLFRIAFACSALTLVFALLTFVGWISGLSLLASVRARYIPMAPSTALCFCLIAIGLILHLQKPQRRFIPRVLTAIVLLVALAKLVEFFTGLAFGIDAWLVRHPGTFGAVPTGRMAPLTAANFAMVAAGLLSLTSISLRKAAAILGSLTMMSSAIVLVGYWYGTPLLYGGSIIPVALSTGWAFFLSGIAVIAAAGPEVWPLGAFLGESTRALLLRTFVPLIIAAALVNGWIGASMLKHWHVNPALVDALCALVFAGLITAIVSEVSYLVGGRIDRAEEARNLAQAELLAL